jgi:hypothetical protein
MPELQTAPAPQGAHERPPCPHAPSETPGWQTPSAAQQPAHELLVQLDALGAGHDIAASETTASASRQLSCIGAA